MLNVIIGYSFCVVVIIVVVNIVIAQALFGWTRGSGAKYVHNNSGHDMPNY